MKNKLAISGPNPASLYLAKGTYFNEVHFNLKCLCSVLRRQVQDFKEQLSIADLENSPVIFGIYFLQHEADSAFFSSSFFT